MTLKTNRTSLLCYFKLCASFRSHWCIKTWVRARKRRIDLWPWTFAWTLLWSLLITRENSMMIQWWEHSQKGVTDGQTDNTICRAAWSQLKIWWYVSKIILYHLLYHVFYRMWGKIVTFFLYHHKWHTQLQAGLEWVGCMSVVENEMSIFFTEAHSYDVGRSVKGQLLYVMHILMG